MTSTSLPGVPEDNARAPSREERKRCWDSRDKYWKCMDQNGKDSGKCTALRDDYEHLCPAQWVKHFDRKYVYTQYKKKIEEEGFDPVEEDRKAKSSRSGAAPTPSKAPS